MPSTERLKKIQTVLDDFAIGTMNFAKNKIYLPRKKEDWDCSMWSPS
jgi:hypothetical protein